MDPTKSTHRVHSPTLLKDLQQGPANKSVRPVSHRCLASLPIYLLVLTSVTCHLSKNLNPSWDGIGKRVIEVGRPFRRSPTATVPWKQGTPFRSINI